MPTMPHRILVLGDSITDGNTWPQIVMQALRGDPAGSPALICAGAGGDTTARMGERLPDLLAQLRPALVLVQAGTNDALRDVPVADWIAALRGIIATCRTAGAGVMIGTVCTLGDRSTLLDILQNLAAPQRLRAQYLVALNTWGVPLAATAERLTEAEATGQVMVADGIHPAYHGQAAIARAWLDALGHTAVAIPTSFDPRAYPGLITHWQIRVAEQPAAPWRDLVVPEPAPDPAARAEEWPEQMRRNGFFMGLGEAAFIARANLTLANAGWLQIGGGAISTVHFNDTLIYRRDSWHGYHLGSVRLPLAAAPGTHQLTVECHGGFALALTRDAVWEDAWGS
jgi:lysophospholipase L1-like esterase